MASKSNVIIASGKRKQAIARAILRPGKGNLKINSTPISEYKPEMFQLRMQEPIIIAGDIAQKVDIQVNIRGGGQSGQAEAARLAIARALVKHSKSEDLKKAYLDYDRHLVVADVRRNEPHKPNKSAPRAKRQKSYR
jgi:small subunit ribosomal protein S9